MADIKQAMRDRVSQVSKALTDLGFYVDTSWYANITTWLIWYMGFDPEFHVYSDGEEGKTNEIQISRLNMAKTVCEDWASLLLGEKTEIKIKDKASSEWLLGKPDDQQQGGVFGETNFWARANELVEKSFALGMGAIVPRIKEATLNDAGKIIGGKVSIDFFTADQIFPLTYENRTITSCAFVSERMDKKDVIITVQIHEPGRITYKFYKSTKDGLEMVDMGPDYAQEIEFTDKELFLPAFIYPQINNHLDITTPFGVSVYSTAIDVLKGVDLAFDNFLTDIELGRKFVFVGNEMLMEGPDGQKIVPQKTRKRLFEKVGGDLPPTGDKDPFIHEYNPDLRIAENQQAVQAQLDYLSFKCGLGPKFYRFKDGKVATATEVISDNSVLFRNRQKHGHVIERALLDVARNTLKLGVELGVQGLQPDTPITVISDDSVITDTNTEKMLFLQEIAAGVRQPWEYRVRFLGEDEARAKKMIESEPIIDRFNLDDTEPPQDKARRTAVDAQRGQGQADDQNKGAEEGTEN